MDFSKVIAWLSWNEIPPEFFSSILAMIVVIILAVVIRVKLNKYDPLKKPKGFMHGVEIIVEFADKQVQEIMGPAFKNYGGFVLCLGAYIFIGFFIGMIGLPNVLQLGSHEAFKQLPNPFTNLAMPLSIALVSFGLTHYTSIKYKKARYFERFVEPFPVFLPINLITVWSSVLSLTLRLFGNALAGYCVITLIYLGLGTSLPPQGSYTGFVITPFISPIAHLYFDIFDGALQTIVFLMLTMINVGGEYISKEDLENLKREEHEEKLAKKQRKLAKREAKALKKSRASA